MAQFEIYTHKFDLDGETYYLRPVGGDYLELLFEIMTDMAGKDEGKEMKVNDIDPKAIAKIHKLCFETFKKSYPALKVEDLDAWVGQNLFKVFDHVIKVNMRQT